ncbi:MAG: serine--tRNA ligase [Spirochaetales bacterium]|nr:serine--tRNA ligase [Spirochaetales bacterium]
MLDLNFLRDNLDAVLLNVKNRYMTADPQEALRLADERSRLLQTLEARRAARNENAGKMKGKLEPDLRTSLIEEGRQLKEAIATVEEELVQVEASFKKAMMALPNMAHPDAPVGKLEGDNLEIKRVGIPTTFDFAPLDHVQLGEKLDIIDFDAGTKVSGTKFYFLKNEGVFLELGLVRYALDLLTKKGFTPLITPDIAKEEILAGIGFNPRGEESNIYPLEGTGTCLVGTAEITLGGYYSEEILDLSQGPIKMAGVSHCFRREAGAHGQFSKGLYRVHQFTKVEMFVYCRPEESNALHEELRGIEEELFTSLQIPFRVVDTCTGDLGAPAYRKYDLEAWMPGRGEGGDWGEITSTSNCTDFQARRLGIRYKDDAGRNRPVHMLNGTAVAVSRAIVAILENFQQKDGSVRLPPALVPYCGFEVIKPRK